MVLELKVPHSPTLAALAELWPVFLSYVLSFVFLGIIGTTSPHDARGAANRRPQSLGQSAPPFPALAHAVCHGLDGRESFHGSAGPLYGVILLCAACAYRLLQRSLIKAEGPDSLLAEAIGSDWKGKLSPIIYLAAIGVALVRPFISCALYFLVAVICISPDPRIERKIARARGAAPTVE